MAESMKRWAVCAGMSGEYKTERQQRLLLLSLFCWLNQAAAQKKMASTNDEMMNRDTAERAELNPVIWLTLSTQIRFKPAHPCIPCFQRSSIAVVVFAAGYGHI